MPVTSDKPAPYAPPSAVLDIIERHRSRGLPSPVDAEVLGRAGISDSLTPRTLQALQALDLIGENGNPTEVFEAIRLAPEAGYKERLAEWLATAYADVLAYVDPASDDDTKIRDAFRPYKPTGQQPRMVTLFKGLYEAAGIVPKKAVTTPPRDRTRTRSKPRQKPKEKPPAAGDPKFTSLTSVPPALEALLGSLPEMGEAWTQEKRDRFLTTFGAVLDFCFPIAEPSAPPPEKEEEDNNEEG